MPSRPRKPCTNPGCSELVANGRCATHARQAEQIRGSSSERGYGTRWARRRADYIYRHPWCVLCGRPSKVPDHYPVSRKDLVDRGETDPDADRHLRPLCSPCHSSETAKHQPGGWNAR